MCSPWQLGELGMTGSLGVAFDARFLLPFIHDSRHCPSRNPCPSSCQGPFSPFPKNNCSSATASAAPACLSHRPAVCCPRGVVMATAGGGQAGGRGVACWHRKSASPASRDHGCQHACSGLPPLACSQACQGGPRQDCSRAGSSFVSRPPGCRCLGEVGGHVPVVGMDDGWKVKQGVPRWSARVSLAGRTWRLGECLHVGGAVSLCGGSRWARLLGGVGGWVVLEMAPSWCWRLGLGCGLVGLGPWKVTFCWFQMIADCAALCKISKPWLAETAVAALWLCWASPLARVRNLMDLLLGSALHAPQPVHPPSLHPHHS